MSNSFTIFPNTATNVIANSTTTSGAYLVSNGSGSSSWTANLINDLTPTSIKVSGGAEFEGDVTVQGISLMETLNRIEERLAILHPNVELEQKWEQLKGLRQMYMELEAEIIEKEKMWAILKR